MVDMRAALVIVSGTVYGPPPTRKVVPGGVINTWAAPMPADAIGGSPRGGEAAPGRGLGAACGAGGDTGSGAGCAGVGAMGAGFADGGGASGSTSASGCRSDPGG